MKPDVNVVRYGLWVGADCSLVPEEAAQQRQWLYDQGIRCVIDVRHHSEIDPEAEGEFYQRGGISHFWVDVDDNGEAPPDQFWWQGTMAVSTALLESPQVLVHCHMGINRAPSLVAALLIEDFQYDPIHALETVRQARPSAYGIYLPDYCRYRANTALDDKSHEQWLDHARKLRRWISRNTDREAITKAIGQKRTEDREQQRRLRSMT